MTDTSSDPIEVFISYAHEDELLLKELLKYLTPLKRRRLIREWHDHMISGGEAWAEVINEHLNTAEVILLLVSPDFMASDYCDSVECRRALERGEAREAVVIPILLRPAIWKSHPIGKFQVLPTNSIPVVSWPNPDEAFLNIAESIEKAAEKLSTTKPLVIIDPPITGGHAATTGRQHIIPVTAPNSWLMLAVRCALVAAGAAAAVALVAGLRIDYKVAVLGFLLMLGLTFGLLLLSRFAQRAAASLRPLALTLAWAFVALIAVTSLCIFTGFFFSWPASLETYVGGAHSPQPGPSVVVGHSPTPTPTTARPTIIITDVPPYDPVGGTTTLAPIAGEVWGAAPQDYRVVLYAHTTSWFVQPMADDPFTLIGHNGRWNAEIHLGKEYAALLVKPTFSPPATVMKVPDVGGEVVAVDVIQGKK